MAVAALVVYAVWFVVAFVVRSVLQHRRTGDTGLRRPGTGRAERLAAAGFGIALLVGVAAPLADLAGLDPIALLDKPALRAVGLAVAVVGVALTLGAQLAMGDSWRVGVDPAERTALVTTGVFGVVRNPIFSAMAVTAAGLALMVPNAVALVGLAALVAALEVQVRLVEEPYLLAVHGQAYADYRRRVGRFVPKGR
jgi:protein-S-isoprenylcysteine O-methyltransferase Ste14